jgi:hypothetical protein
MKKLTLRQRAELDALARLPDNRIDTSDIPEMTFTPPADRKSVV